MVTVLRASDRPAALDASNVVSAASGNRAIAPGSLVSLYGSNLTAITELNTASVAPTRLAGEQITVNGFPVGQLYASPSQINFQIPFEVPAGPVALVHTSGAMVGNPVPLTIAPYAPAIFVLPQVSGTQGAVLISGSSSVAAASGSIKDARPARAGEYISIYCTGLGAVSNPPFAGVPAATNPLSQTAAPATVTIGGVSVPAVFAGLAPYYVGLNQVNVLVPASVPKGSAVPITIAIGGETSNAATIAIE